jgi:hypothetical protein
VKVGLRQPPAGAASAGPVVGPTVLFMSYGTVHVDKAVESIMQASREPLTAEDHIAIAQVNALLAIATELAAYREGGMVNRLVQ